MENNLAKTTAPHMVLEPRSLLERAIASGAGVDVIERLMDMQERWEDNQARKAFNAAIAAFKKSPPAILKSIEVGFGKTSYKHEDLAELLGAVDPALAEHGLWVRFRIGSADNKVTVTCVVGHSDGYSESNSTLTAAPDTSGSKNQVQAIGSTVSYLQRYTLKAALGLAAARDDDGRGGNGHKPVVSNVITDEEADEIREVFKQYPKIPVDTFLKKAEAASIADITAVKLYACKTWLKKRVEEQEAAK